MRAPRPGWIVVALAFLCLVWGSTWLAIRVTTRDLPPFGAASVRFLLAAAIIGAVRSRRPLPGQARPGGWFWLGLALCMISIPYACVYWGEMYIPTGMAAVLFATYPLFVALLAHVGVEGERMSARLAAGVATSFAGVVLLFSSDLEGFHPKFIVGGSLVLVSACSSALASILVKRTLTHLDPLLINLRPMLLGGAVLGLASLLCERNEIWRLTPRGAFAVVYLAVVGSAAAFAVYYWLMRHIPVSRLAFVTYVTPVVALLLGRMLEGEPFTPRIATGTAFVIGGIVLARKAPLARQLL